jgi:hypothetical protein
VCQAAALSNAIMISARSRARKAAPTPVPDKAASGAAKNDKLLQAVFVREEIKGSVFPRRGLCGCGVGRGLPHCVGGV